MERAQLLNHHDCFLSPGCYAENLHQSFRLEPENVTVQEGETVLLKCEVDNLSGLVQWVKDGLLLGPNLDIPRFPRYRMVGEPSKGEKGVSISDAFLMEQEHASRWALFYLCLSV